VSYRRRFPRQICSCLSSPEETYDQFNTNVFGPLNVNRAFLPYMRERKSGTIVWVGSMAGCRGAANAGLYVGTKHAVRGLSLSLQEEVAPLGIRSVCFEPGSSHTSILNADNQGQDKVRNEDYREIVEVTNARVNAFLSKRRGDPKKLAEVMIDVIKGEGIATGKEFPSVVALGSDAYSLIKYSAKETLNSLETWKQLTISTDHAKDD